MLKYNFISATIAKNTYYISKANNNMLNSYKSINIALEITSNLDIIKGKAYTKELGITSS